MLSVEDIGLLTEVLIDEDSSGIRPQNDTHAILSGIPCHSE